MAIDRQAETQEWIWRIYEAGIRERAAEDGGKGTIIDKRLIISASKKAVTASTMQGFTDTVPCYYLYALKQLASRSGELGDMSQFTFQTAIAFVPQNVEMKVLTHFGNKALLDIDIVDFIESGGRKESKDGQEIRDAILSGEPLDLPCGFCKCLTFDYKQAARKVFKFEDQKKMGVEQEYIIDTKTGKAGA